MTSRRKPPSQRQLRVGEMIRHALADILLARRLDEPDLDTALITVTEVEVSPDLKHATVFVRPLADAMRDGLEERLNARAGHIRGLLAGPLRGLRYMPRLNFRLDPAQDHAAHIDSLLRDPRVARDLRGDAEDEDG